MTSLIIMLSIKDLSPEENFALNEMHINHPLHSNRRRAHAILLSQPEYSVPKICSIYNVCRQTVSTWFTHWEKNGIDGLVDCQGRGR